MEKMVRLFYAVVDSEGGRCLMHRPPVVFRFFYYFSQMIFTGMIPVSSLLFSSGWLQPA